MKSTDGDRKTEARDCTGIPSKFSLLKYFSAFLVSVSILACSHFTPQEKQESKESTSIPPDCGRNYTKEFNLFSGTTHKAWDKYDKLDYNKAFEAAVFSIQNNGHSITSTDRGSGTVHGQMVSGSRQQTPDPIDVRIANENSSLVVRLSFKDAGEARDQLIACRFYEEFERLVKQVPAAVPPNETPKPTFKPGQPPSIKVQEPVKPSAPAVEAKQKPAPSPLLPPPSRITEIVWVSVNLREGPGMNYRVIGSAKKGTSLRVYEDKGIWLRVRLEDGKEVWVSKSATPEAPKTSSTPSPSPDPPPSPSSKRALSKPVSPM
ncbi:MAG: hypothetical protein A2170_17465 [Deltaproteobacteria bacterium RBG_13_53_10]|nr:MAG: hypothetical protein A2170_17465 [Deltaproteobacteria bacterium RBG_13_53_10]